MKNYDRIHARKPKDIENRRAHIIGGGIAGLAAAAFLAVDGHMPGENITVYEQRPQVGGSLDGSGNATDGYLNRGDRELEPYMECLWYLFGMVPSLEEEGRTVLDETREDNKRLPIFAKKRLFECGFRPRDISTLGLSPKAKELLLKLFTTPEDKIENVTIEAWFPADFFESNLWFYWASMLAFRPYHSLIEMKRYVVRFVQHLDGIEHLKGILRTKYDQYSSLIVPLRAWLDSKGVRFETNTTVAEIGMRFDGHVKTAVSIETIQEGQQSSIPVRDGDLVFFTNGSMTQNSSPGSNTEVASIHADTRERGVFTVWEKLAKQSPVFGNPAKFLSSPDMTRFVSFTVTMTDYPDLFEHLERRTENVTGESGAITLVDSPWFLSINVPPQPAFKDQPDNLQVFWGYGLIPNVSGELVRKPMTECTGQEILQELLFQMDFDEHYEDLIPHTKIITTMMPYITSQFMPRTLKDRPQVIPEGCTNLAFIGQFVELEGDVVFTVETSVRTAMVAVYRMLQLDKPITPLFEGQYDIRIIVATLKKVLGTEAIHARDLLPNPLKIPEVVGQVLDLLNGVPSMKSYYPEAEENCVSGKPGSS